MTRQHYCHISLSSSDNQHRNREVEIKIEIEIEIKIEYWINQSIKHEYFKRVESVSTQYGCIPMLLRAVATVPWTLNPGIEPIYVTVTVFSFSICSPYFSTK